MTEELKQKAKEWTRKTDNHLNEEKTHFLSETEYAENAYIAGATENCIEWHDLRKDPNDLPEKMGLGSREVYIEYKSGVTDFAYYRFDKKRWVRSENEELAENVIAWCEIPRFNSED